MKGRSALVTGAASGIGHGIAGELASLGYDLTLVDLDASSLQAVATELRQRFDRSAALPASSAFPNSSSSSSSSSTQPVGDQVQIRTAVVDVTNAAAQRAAFLAHSDAFGGPQVVVLNAGIGERGSFFDPANQGWQTTLDVDLTAVLYGIRAAAEVMTASGGTIIAVASAGAVFPMPVAPVYAAAKAGVAHFVRSAARGLAARHPPLRLLALCPEFVETPLVTRLVEQDPSLARQLLGSLDIKLLTPKYVAGIAARMVVEEEAFRPGAVGLIRQDGEVVFPYARQKKVVGGAAGGESRAAGVPVPGGSSAQRVELASWALRGLPTEYKKIVITTLSSKYREAARLVSTPLLYGTPPRPPPPPGALLVRRVFAGVNASDINYSSGRYHTNPAEARSKLPFDAGFESVNVVMAVGEGVKNILPGDCVAALSYGSFSEYGIEPARSALPVPRVAAELVALLTSGLTASIALEEAGRVKAGDVVLVTAAAGGTGQFAVQLAKAVGCRVVATCGGADKARLLRELGADRVINYNEESVKAVLKREFPSGVDVVYESVGGDMFSTAVDALATRGRLIIIGMMAAYGSGWAPGTYPGLAEKLLWKSAAAEGFFLLRYASLFRSHFARLVSMWEAGRLRVTVDPRVFVGVESVFDAVDHLHSGRSVGKVVVQLSKEPAPDAGFPAAVGQTLSKL